MSQFNFDELSEFARPDVEKRELIDSLVHKDYELHSMRMVGSPDLKESSLDKQSQDIVECNACFSEDVDIYEKHVKYCPKCGRRYPEGENFCFECLVNLKDIDDLDVFDIEIAPDFQLTGSNEFTGLEEILTQDNLIRISDYDLDSSDFKGLIRNINLKAFKTLDGAIKDNGISLDDLPILDKIILFAKSFVNLEYKSYGRELGSFVFDTIYIDDRQVDALQITTILHELTHFLINEILSHLLCLALDCTKTNEIRSIATFILSYSNENCLIDEYAAHTVEGRFTLLGYQDYSSFLNIQKSMERSSEEIEMIKAVGNTFANAVKEIFESFIDRNMLDEIKDQFKRDITEQPNYSRLSLETCTLLTEEGLLKYIKYMLTEGFAVSMESIGQIREINEMW